MSPTFSIIIPVKEVNDYVRETVPWIQRLEDSDWELFVVTNDDALNEWSDDPRIQFLSSGRVGPAEKRDQAASVAHGEILVFLDDDSYPQPDLLSVARRYFNDPSVSAVGGPAITPESDTYRQKISGAVFMSKLTGGSPERYIPVGSARDVDDWPSVNLMVRRTAFLSVNGFNSPYWPGEDTFLCHKLVRAKHRIIYAPDLVVWHHRREGLRRHLRQVGAYGLHRGYFARKYPQTSLKVQYFVPSLLLLFTLLSIVTAIVTPQLLILFAIGWSFYGIALIVGLFTLVRRTGYSVAIGSLPYVVMTHLVYGWMFLRGLSHRGQLVSRLR
jgi:GT2 family glycosyltransferase